MSWWRINSPAGSINDRELNFWGAPPGSIADRERANLAATPGTLADKEIVYFKSISGGLPAGMTIADYEWAASKAAAAT